MSPTTDEIAYLQQRMAEEQSKAASSSCVVRAVHNDFVDAYQERIETIAIAKAESSRPGD